MLCFLYLKYKRLSEKFTSHIHYLPRIESQTFADYFLSLRYLMSSEHGLLSLINSVEKIWCVRYAHFCFTHVCFKNVINLYWLVEFRRWIPHSRPKCSCAGDWNHAHLDRIVTELDVTIRWSPIGTNLTFSPYNQR